ncbi:hypothetical protein OQI89_00480 [Lentilactobacillus diolivorans]|uniref:hypothetical protein n=1 Tax=Lentilactobacillus diolivorans TaxID=179838 RepID=UPI00246915F6|nr:hypothetical protein [Lentilactobacillus diolivorans]MDH5104317.1 hypothetical protein [Lentilactobacillus diolivorans]
MVSNENEDRKITTNELLANYSHAIQSGLDNGTAYIKSFNVLNETQDTQELLSAAVKLTSFQLDTDFVTFPHKFSDEDIQLVFLERLLTLSGIENELVISNPEHVQKLLCKFSKLGDKTFTFSRSSKNPDGFFFGPTMMNRPLFYVNLKAKELMFHGSSLIEYFVVDLEGIKTDEIKSALQVMVKAAQILKESFGFKIDFNVLDSVNGEFYAFASGDLPDSIMDELFVKSAENHFILMSAQNGGASLTLDDKTEVTVYDAGDASRPKWGATIHDQDQKESWLCLLLDYPFIKEWYLRNQKQLEILSNQFIFG